MSINIFGWLRKQARDAILGGVADAVEQLGDETGDAVAELPDGLKLRVALVAPVQERPRAKVK